MEDDDDVSADASPSPVSSPAASALPVADPVTVAAAPPGSSFAHALPIQRTAASLYVSSTGGGGGGGGREDAWSEGATSALIDAWGERFVALGRGSLRHPQWQEVAEAVSSRDGYSKAPKSDVQCKNRIDTLKKKYKVERAKPVSSWQFFDRLDALLAPTYAEKPSATVGGGHNPNGRNPVPAALRAGFPQRSRTPLVPAAVKRREPSPEPSASSESSDGFPPPAFPLANGKRRRTDEDRGGDGGSDRDRAQGLRELGLAIRRLGEAYERVETAKLEQAMEMERRRMEFARELESQRMQFFLNTQMELTQSKNHSSSPVGAAVPPSATTVGGGSRRMSSANDAGGSSNNHHSRYRISHGDRHHRHAPRQHYRYHHSNHASVAANEGVQTDEEDGEEDDESQ